MVYESTSEVTFANAAAGPIDDLRCEYAADAKLFAKAEQHDVHRRRIGIGELREIANTHHQFGIRVAIANFDVATQAGGKAKADRLNDRVDSQPHASGGQLVDGFIEAG